MTASRTNSRNVINNERFNLTGGAARDRITLDCGHILERAPRPSRPKRIYCPECPE